eukprot:scaffold52343_cov56-Phaeocystis_antarctica.AAC.4
MPQTSRCTFTFIVCGEVEGPPPLSCVLMSVGFTVVGFGMGLGFKMVMLQMRKLRLSSRAREEGGAEAVSGVRVWGLTKLRGGTVGAGSWERCVGWGAGAAAGWDGCPQWVAHCGVRPCPHCTPTLLHPRIGRALGDGWLWHAGRVWLEQARRARAVGQGQVPG